MAKSGNWTAPKLSDSGDMLRKSLSSSRSAKKEPMPNLTDRVRYQARQKVKADEADASRKRKAKSWRDPATIKRAAATEKSARGKNERAAARKKKMGPKGPQGRK